MASKLSTASSWLMNSMPENKEEALRFVKEHKWELLAAGTIGYLTYKVMQLRKLPPGPYGIPLLGYMLQAAGFADGRGQKLMAEYGEISSVQMGFGLQIWINSARLLKEAYVHRSSEFSFRPESNWNKVFDFHDDIFSAPYDEQWKKNKKFLTGALKTMGFGSNTLEGKILTEADALIAYLEKLQEEAGEEGVCLKEPVAWTAANLICNIIFSQHYEPDDAELKGMMKMSADLVDIDVATYLLVESVPFWLGKHLFTKTIRSAEERSESLQAFFRPKIDEHMTSRTPGEPRDFIDAYLDERDGPTLDYRRMLHNCLIFLPDALDSLPKMLEWMIVGIAANPDVQTKLHKELDDVVGRSREPLLKDKKDLHYLEACLEECYRFSNIFLSLAAHTVEKDTTLGGYTIPKGCQIMGNVYAIHTNAELFPNPEEFKPERHLDADGKFTPNETVVPFGLGPRACAGQPLSKMELFLLAAKLFHRLEFRFPKGQDAMKCLEGTMRGFQRCPKDYTLIIKRR
ncbi:hypothetical protein CAPTEDRAFT_184189 [Capitella teleta]|uniref:Cytochrome P450 n=1 Tax=Capitella teleta TaxID=283909 RepID=R7UG44_CAPTE|nr:hypothetical protein CAPTEDRAFT_184189 [Capitella teleta]|eukprot:ELU05504.1 hypothetical protein CAPTEDRAFT_184189 [Capitella teleta]